MSGFVKAIKGKKPLRLVIAGASGAGKSFTALNFASYLAKITGKPTAAIDTEHGRLSLYADKYAFDVMEMEPPFNPNRLIEKIHEAEKAGYGQLIVDSSSHFWFGTGGVLEIVNDAARTKFGGNTYAGWAVGTPLQNAVIDAIIRSPMHIIFTTRAKQAYVENEKGGKKTYEKQGYDMVQREGFEFDFDFALMMDMDNNALVTKGMGEVTPGMYFKKPGEDTIAKIMESIQTNSVEVKADRAVEKTPDQIRKSIRELFDGSTEEIQAKQLKLIEKYAPSGKIKEITDVANLENLYNEMKELGE